jgi:hypothetical protein
MRVNNFLNKSNVENDLRLKLNVENDLRLKLYSFNPDIDSLTGGGASNVKNFINCLTCDKIQ